MTRLNFGLTCPHCGKALTGERIVGVSVKTWGAFIYTESDHQLMYVGLHLKGVACLEEEEGK